MNSLLNQSNNMAGELKALQSNPIQFLLQHNLNVPNNIVNNPQAIANWLVESGQRTPQQLAQAKQMLGL